MPMWLEHKEQGKKNMAEAMTGQKGRDHTMQDLVSQLDATTKFYLYSKYNR